MQKSDNRQLGLASINPRPTKGGGVLSPAAQKRKRKWPRASRTSLLHPLRSFWWKKPGGTPEDGGRVSRQSSKVRGGGWLPPQNILSRHFEKYLHGMVLKLSGHVRNTISLLYLQKTRWNSDIWNFFSEKVDFLSILVYVHWKSAFRVRPCLKTSLWRHTLTDFHDFGISGKRRPYPSWYQTIILWARQFQVHPLGKPCYKKRLGRTRVKHSPSTKEPSSHHKYTVLTTSESLSFSSSSSSFFFFFLVYSGSYREHFFLVRLVFFFFFSVCIKCCHLKCFVLSFARMVAFKFVLVQSYKAFQVLCLQFSVHGWTQNWFWLNPIMLFKYLVYSFACMVWPKLVWA